MPEQLTQPIKFMDFSIPQIGYDSNPYQVSGGNTTPMNFNKGGMLDFSSFDPSVSTFNNDQLTALESGGLIGLDGSVAPETGGGLLDFFGVDTGDLNAAMDMMNILQGGYSMFAAHQGLDAANKSNKLRKTGFNNNVAMTQGDLQARRNAQIESTGYSNIPEVNLGKA